MHLLRSLALTLLALAIPPAAHAGEWYMQSFVGVNFADDIEFDTDLGGVETSLDTGWLWSIGFGYQFKHVRLDAEVDTPREADVDVHRVDGSTQSGSTGDVQSEAGMGNVLFDFRKDKRLSPYVGAGIGWAEIELNALSTDTFDLIAGEDTVFAWQILGGLGLTINDDWILDFSLRYYDAQEGEFSTSTAAGDDTVDVDYSAFSVTAGVRYVF